MRGQRILLLRHAATAGNAERRYVGRTDQPLSPEGRSLAASLAGAFRADRVFASPMQRASETARLFFPQSEIELLDGLREMDFGIFELKNAEELSDSAAYRAWVDGGCESRCPGGEGRADYSKRVLEAFFSAVGSAKEAESIAFVTHGGAIMEIMSALAEPPRGFFWLWRVKNCHGFEARLKDGRLTEVGEI